MFWVNPKPYGQISVKFEHRSSSYFIELHISSYTFFVPSVVSFWLQSKRSSQSAIAILPFRCKRDNTVYHQMYFNKLAVLFAAYAT